MDRVALYLQDKHPIRDGMQYAQLAEQAGFEAVWQAESRLVREATVPMAAFAAVTERIGRAIEGMIEAGQVDPVIGARFPLAKAADALALLDGRGATGKVVLDVS